MTSSETFLKQRAAEMGEGSSWSRSQLKRANFPHGYETSMLFDVIDLLEQRVQDLEHMLNSNLKEDTND